jgi:hypothetical protein
MSAIASFHVLPADRLGDVAAAATPRPRGWFRPAQDGFWVALRSHSRTLDAFEWSGWAFNTLDIYLRDRHGFKYDDFGDATASAQLTKARGSYWMVLPAAAAAELRAAIDGIDPPLEDVTEFVASEHGPAEAAEEAEAVRAALTSLKGWLTEVPEGSVGLLSIG